MRTDLTSKDNVELYINLEGFEKTDDGALKVIVELSDYDVTPKETTSGTGENVKVFNMTSIKQQMRLKVVSPDGATLYDNIVEKTKWQATYKTDQMC